jgi:hypothetical protein
MLLEENSIRRELLMVITFLLLLCVSLLNACMHLYLNAFQLQNMFEQTATQPPPELIQQILMLVVIKLCILHYCFDTLSIVLGGCLSR